MVARDSPLADERAGSVPAAALALEWLRTQLAAVPDRADLIEHAQGTVAIMLESYDDQASVQAAALTSAAEHLDSDQIERQFGLAVRRLVDSVAQISRLRELFRAPGLASGAADLETLRRMTLALASDIRVVLISLASRLQTLRTHARRKSEPAAGVARETLDVLAPLANRLGIWQLKWQLEDLAFRFLQPQQYKQLATQLEQRRAEREEFLRDACDELGQLLVSNGVRAQVSWRPKHIYSIHAKMKSKNLDLAQVLDLRAMRVIVDDVKSCYAGLAVVHQRWQAIASEYDDYIARPKPNGYQSLHTVVTADDGRPLEIQLRTAVMHRAAEYGLAAHWVYKERGLNLSGAAQARDGELQQLAWLRELLAWQQDVGNRLAPAAAPAALPAALSGKPLAVAPRIFVITPQGRIVELPKDATPIDFAYHVHTDLGHRCRGARVDGQMVPLNTPLRNAQVVDIITSRRGQESFGPSRDWLNLDLGYLRSNRARAKVRQWFNAQEQAQAIANGRERIERLMQREGKTALSFESLRARLNYDDVDAMFLAAAREELGPRAIELALRESSGTSSNAATASSASASAIASRVRSSSLNELTPAITERVVRPTGVTASSKGAVLIVGVDSLLTQLAHCCRPLPPDPIIGFVTRGRGISVHRAECHSFARLRQVAGERVVAASWGAAKAGEQARVYATELIVKILERPHLQRDLLDACARGRFVVHSLSMLHSRADQSLQLIAMVGDTRDLDSLLAMMSSINGIVSVRRKQA